MGCTICNGQLALIGVLGDLAHLRCVDCGAEQSVPAAEVELTDEDDDTDEYEYEDRQGEDEGDEENE